MNAPRVIGKVGAPRSEAADAATALLTCLTTLHAQLRGLFDLAGRKMAAIRAADTTRLNQCTHAESELLQQVAKTERQRGACIARLAQALQVPELRKASLSEVANVLHEPAASQLRAKSAGLRDIADKLQQKNRLAARVAQDLQGHIRSIFAQLAKSRQEQVGYGSTGRHEARPDGRLIVDAMG